jgi:hypothetical protein
MHVSLDAIDTGPAVLLGHLLARIEGPGGAAGRLSGASRPATPIRPI